MSEYTGNLNATEQSRVAKHRAAGLSGRAISKQTNLSYGRVRGYLEWLEKSSGAPRKPPTEPADNLEALGLAAPPDGGPKMLVFDIETAPYKIWSWGLWKTSALDIDEEWYMLSFSYGWYDYRTQELESVHWVGLPDDPTWRGGSNDDRYVVERLWALLHEAEIVIGQNHERFDVRKANERFFIHKMLPPSPFQNVDLMKHYKVRFSGSPRLKYMARRAEVALKESNSGLQLWFDCMAGDVKAWREMERYNRGDVVTTAELYVRLLPWIGQLGKPAHPNMGHYVPAEGGVCPNCGNKGKDEGGQGFTIRKWRWDTAAYRYPVLQCKACGRYSKGYQSLPDTRTELR
jgi:hypothetical protein